MSLVPVFEPGLLNLVTALLVVANINFAAAPADTPATAGAYRISRNPIYVFSAIAVLGMAVAGASWLLAALMLLANVANHQVIIAEEQFCEGKYGNAYREYRRRVRRYL